MKLIIGLFLTTQIYAAPVNIAWFELTRPWTTHLIERYLVTPDVREPLQVLSKGHFAQPENRISEYTGKDVHKSAISANFSWSVLPPNAANIASIRPVPTLSGLSPNPFLISDFDFDTGGLLPWPLTMAIGAVPMPDARDLPWFEMQRRLDVLPDVLVIGGHHVISEGFHNDAENKFLFEPTLEKTVETYPPAMAYFKNVKLAILFGCNTLTDLEPHHDDGSAMSSEEIRGLYQSGPEGRLRVIGSSKVINSLEFYKDRLAREYGPRSDHYDYTRNEKEEQCKGPAPFQNCKVANLERIMPEAGLFDGSHRYNQALRMARLFSNAYLVLGFSSASPSEELRVQILQEAVSLANQKLKLKGTNVIQRIVDPASSESLRVEAIKSLREAWEIVTFKINRGRPSGSITPAYPAIDGGYVMNLKQTKDSQLYSKYRM